jgi:hypothetical protein
MFRNKVVFSPVEIEYLLAHRQDPLDQLCIALAKSKNAIKNKLGELDGKAPTSKKKMAKRSIVGKRTDLNLFTRSGWEANVCRYLKHQQMEYQYEPTTFFFSGVKKGTVIYTPDLYVPSLDAWIEVKGYIDARGKTAIRRFKKHYPEEFKKLKAVVGRKGTAADKFFKEMGVPIYCYYHDIDRLGKTEIPHWE